MAAVVALLTAPVVGCTAADPVTDGGPTGATATATSAVDVERGPGVPVTVPPVRAAPVTTFPGPTAVPTPTYALPAAPEPLPQPVAPPADDTAPEPVVALGRIAIPALGVDRPLFEGIRLPTFDMGPGHWPGTAMPGQVGNMVIGGHRTAGHADFADIDQLQPGDHLIVTDATGAPFTYAVESVEIADPFAPRIVYQTSERTATLFACHPPGSVARRVIVHLTLLA